MQELRDIRELAVIPDFSIYIIVVITFILVLLMIVLIYEFVNYLKRKKSKNIRKEVYKRLKNIDFSNSKKAAYQITKYGRFLSHDETVMFSKAQTKKNSISNFLSDRHLGFAPVKRKFSDEKAKEIFNLLQEKLQPYKYKKEVDKIDEDTKRVFNLFLEVIHE